MRIREEGLPEEQTPGQRACNTFRAVNTGRLQAAAL